MVQAYLEARKLVEDIEERHKQEVADPREDMYILESVVLDYLRDNDVQNLTTADGGKVYKSTRWSASIADGEAFMDYVIKTEGWHLLDKRANKTAVQDYLKEHNVEPPGIRLTGNTILCAQKGRSKVKG